MGMAELFRESDEDIKSKLRGLGEPVTVEWVSKQFDRSPFQARAILKSLGYHSRQIKDGHGNRFWVWGKYTFDYTNPASFTCTRPVERESPLPPVAKKLMVLIEDHEETYKDVEPNELFNTMGQVRAKLTKSLPDRGEEAAYFGDILDQTARMYVLIKKRIACLNQTKTQS